MAILAFSKKLIQKLNDLCVQALNRAATVAIEQQHYEITLEHWLLALLQQEKSDLTLLCRQLELAPEKFRQLLQSCLHELPTGCTTKPAFSPFLFEALENAWLLASVELGENTVRSYHLLLALQKNKRLLNDKIQIALKTLAAEKMEQAGACLQYGDESKMASEPSKMSTPDPAYLTQFASNLSEAAKAGKIDPVLGRSDEIRQAIDILSRRRKNNPILLGHAGVGKTAVAEGIALAIAQGDVPDHLKSTTVYALDLTRLEAGASIKGEFEKRLQKLIEEIKAAPAPIILFIDEAHSLIGAGGQQGHDAANILKPALARGELRVIGATTWREYKQYIEKDPALARRFQPVKLEPPNSIATLQILRGLKNTYEKAHGVAIRDDALESMVKLSDRYLVGRQQPDKAIDLMDTCAAKVKANLSAPPKRLVDLQHRIANLERELTGLARDHKFGQPLDRKQKTQEKLLQQSLKKKQKQAAELAANWREEQACIRQILECREQLTQADPKTEKALKTTLQRLERNQQKLPLLHYEVCPQLVAQVVSQWTGIPLGQMLKNEAQLLQDLPQILQQQVVGQEQGLAHICETLQQAKVGLKADNQPLGIFLLAGPTGVGKTETALTVAKQLFGSEEALITINMSEFQEKHTISRLIGSPPGYVGFGEGGRLTEAVRQRPYSVVLLDEIEKASLDVLNLFYQVFDKGSLTDGEGQEVSFANTVIFLTSNLAADEIWQLWQAKQDITLSELTESIQPVLSHWLKPALLARTTVVPYLPLSTEALGNIAKLKVHAIRQQVQHAHPELSLEITETALSHIAQQCETHLLGARALDTILKAELKPLLAKALLNHLAQPAKETQWTIELLQERLSILAR